MWEVDDAPRYQGISDWVTTDGKTFWQSTADAPVPRRDYTVRNDYNILRRGNRVVLTKDGWTHEQDNDKVVKSDAGEKLIAQEKGYNIYTYASENDCAAAKRWWEQSHAFWNTVRQEWTAHLATLSSIQLQAKADDKRLIQYFDELFAKWQKGEVASEAVPVHVKALLQKFVQPVGASTAKN